MIRDIILILLSILLRWYKKFGATFFKKGDKTLIIF